MNGGSIIASKLKEHNVKYIFTVCGGHISPILTETKRLGINVIDVRHEVNAVFAADAIGRITGTPGVAVVTAGPGVTNSLTALVNANMAQSPLIVFGGASATILRGKGALQDIDQLSLIKHAVKSLFSIKKICELTSTIESAFKIALSDVPGPVFIECPIDLLYDETLVRQWYIKKGSTSKDVSLRENIIDWYLNYHLNKIYDCNNEKKDYKTIPPKKPKYKYSMIEKTLKLIYKSKSPLLIVGSQALLNVNLVNKLQEAINRLGIPFYLTGMSRGLLGDSNPLQFHYKRNEALFEADLVILAGVPCDFRLNYGRTINPKAKIISINLSKQMLRLNCKPDLKIPEDPAEFIIGCSKFIKSSLSLNEWKNTLLLRETQREAEINEFLKVKTQYINPLLLLKKVDKVLNKKSIIIADGGDFVATASYILHPKAPFTWLDPGVFGTLGVGAGFAMGAKLLKSDADVWLIWGDGSAGYGLIEFDTFVRHKIPIIALIGNDAAWMQIMRDQVEYLKDDVATVLRYADYQGIAESLGAKGFIVDHDDQIDEVLKQALEISRKGTPVLINALIGKTDFRKGSISV